MARSSGWKGIAVGAVFLALIAGLSAWQFRPRAGNHEKNRVSLSLMQRAADQGNPQMQCKLGQAYLEGKMLARDYDAAAKWFSKSAEHRCADAYYPLGYLYANGLGVPQDYKQAEHYLRLAAEAKNAAACYGLGELLEYGGGISGSGFISPNPDESLKWYRKAAEAGLPDAQCALADALMRREHINETVAEAERWYRAAAKAKLAKAEYALGQMLESRSKDKNVSAEAISWYQKAADEGYGPAAYQLGLCYKDGRGMASDLSEAYYWIALATSLGSSDAADEKKILGARLSQRQIDRADRALFKWSPRVDTSKKDTEPYSPLL